MRKGRTKRLTRSAESGQGAFSGKKRAGEGHFRVENILTEGCDGQWGYKGGWQLSQKDWQGIVRNQGGVHVTVRGQHGADRGSSELKKGMAEGLTEVSRRLIEGCQWSKGIWERACYKGRRGSERGRIKAEMGSRKTDCVLTEVSLQMWDGWLRLTKDRQGADRGKRGIDKRGCQRSTRGRQGHRESDRGDGKDQLVADDVCQIHVEADRILCKWTWKY